MQRCHGITLWELLLVLVVVSVLSAAGIPGVSAFVLNARRTADVNAFVTAVQLARSEAFKRGRAVVLCKTSDGSSCGGTETEFGRGWMVFVNEDSARPPRRSAAEPLLYSYRPEMTGSIKANRNLFEFRAFGARSTNGTVTFLRPPGSPASPGRGSELYGAPPRPPAPVPDSNC